MIPWFFQSRVKMAEFRLKQKVPEKKMEKGHCLGRAGQLRKANQPNFGTARWASVLETESWRPSLVMSGHVLSMDWLKGKIELEIPILSIFIHMSW